MKTFSRTAAVALIAAIASTSIIPASAFAAPGGKGGRGGYSGGEPDHVNVQRSCIDCQGTVRYFHRVNQEQQCDYWYNQITRDNALYTVKRYELCLQEKWSR